jgi:crossover junction endodeoxyribonuclease RusA
VREGAVVIVSLPWPSPDLSPNARGHWTQLAKAKSAYRQTCAWQAKAAGLGKMKAAELHLCITFCPPDKRRRDLDNLLASLKSGLDGLCDVVGIDDSQWTLTLERGSPTKGGKVVVELIAA